MNFFYAQNISSSGPYSYRNGIGKDLFEVSGLVVIGELLCIS